MRLILRFLTRVLCASALLLGAAGCAMMSEHRVKSEAGLKALTGKLCAGDVVVLANGDWRDQQLVIEGEGTAERPIIVQAKSPGKVVLQGRSSVTVRGRYVTVSGLCLKDGRGLTNGLLIEGQHCRLTETAVIGGTYKFFIHVAGSENRVDHCYVAGKTSESPTLQIEVEKQPNHHRIDHNHFGPRPPLRRNGGETMRVGYSWQSMSNSATVVEENLFDRCDGEIEIISNKSCENIYRNNTFLDCAGMLTLRHGNRCVVENNIFIAHHKRGSGGIRVIGEDHRIINNYIEGVWQGGIWITAGIVNSPLKGYFQARNVLISSNSFLDSRDPAIDVNAGFGSSQRTLRPENVTIENNLFSVPEGGILAQGTEGNNFKWLNNVAVAEDEKAKERRNHVGVSIAEGKLDRQDNGLLDFIGNADNSASSHVGFSAANGKLHPLKPTEVGPTWMTHGTRDL